MEQKKHDIIAGFELIKRDGTREYIDDGILFHNGGRYIKSYVKTNDVSMVFAAGEALSDAISFTDVPLRLKLLYVSRIFMKIMGWCKT